LDDLAERIRSRQQAPDQCKLELRPDNKILGGIEGMKEFTIADTLANSAHNYGSLDALIIGDQRATYQELDEAVNRRANSLLELGVKKGDHVGTLSANSLELVETIYALNRINAVVVPLHLRLSPEELVYIMNHADLSTLVLQSPFESVVEKIKPAIGVNLYLGMGKNVSRSFIDLELETARQSTQPPEIEIAENDTATIIYTSGTTGRPKGVVATHKNWTWQMSSLTTAMRYRFERILMPYPLFHAGGFAGFYTSVFSAGTMYVLSDFDPALMLQTIEKERIVRLGCPPTVYKMLLRSPELAKTDVSSVRYLSSGSEVIPDEVRNQLKKAFPNVGIFENYGLTETCGGFVTRSAEFTDTKPLSVGRPFLTNRLRVVDESGNDVGPDVVGEIICCGPTIMKEYYKDPEKTADAIRNGWLYTGDLGYLDADGFLYIKERKNNMIISGGENIYPKEVEEVLYRHPKILEAAVFGLPDQLWGEKVCAAVIKKPDEQLNAEEVIQFCKKNLASFKKPKDVYFVDALPKNLTGKILRTELKKQFAGEK
jgi:acyl-CoA synthetase (AMP-forming)/AMP-acid ligase II